MTIYMTTDKRASEDGWYACYIWESEPELDEEVTGGEWWQATSGSEHIFAGYFRKDRLAALGFPPPGEIRVVDIGPCEEGE